MTIKRVEIIIETERIVQISSRSKSLIFWCVTCAKLMPAFTVDETALVLRASREEVLRRLEAGQLHLLGNNAGPARVCSSSLLK
ncbi:MAG TPA: hypothetical protein VF543_14070 [Pyrinomonadaceae bacterium]